MDTATAPAPEYLIDLTNSCQCRICDACSVGTEDATCQECGQDTRECTYCDGQCFEYKLDYLEELVEDYAAFNKCEYLRIEGRRMTWQYLSGYAIIKANSKALLDSLTFSGDWSLEFKYDDETNEFTVTRWSHDEPTGASFIISPDKGEDEE